jgi:hypothetical protein
MMAQRCPNASHTEFHLNLISGMTYKKMFIYDLMLNWLYSEVGEAESIWYVGHYLAVHQPRMMDECGTIGGIIGRGIRSTRRRPAPVPFVNHKSHTIWPCSNPGRRGRTPATNSLSYGTAVN